MKKLYILFSLGLGLATLPMAAQETPSTEEKAITLDFSGSADVYYKYDFSGNANIPTSFADEQNSLSIGMLDLALEGTSGKASFMAEIAFGPRNAGSAGPPPSTIPVTSITPTGEVTTTEVPAYAPRIQNLYVAYALTDQLTITGGYMGTFVGYEIISPTGNFNYSTSYLFTNGPFQNAGVKLDYAVNDKFGVMVGLFNPWNVYQSPSDIGLSSFGAQLYVSPVEGWDAYLNFVTGGESGTEVDLTTTFQVAPKTLLGLNAASYSFENDGSEDSQFWGIALYLNQDISDAFAIGARYEHFNANAASGILSTTETAVNAFTISANLKHGNLTFIPELRLDAADQEIFLDADEGLTKSAAQVLFAAVYGF